MKRNRSHVTNAIAAAVIVALAAMPAGAVTIPWTNAAGGNFNTTVNWNNGPGPVPQAADTAQFNLPNTYTVTINTSPNNASLNVGNGDVSFRTDTGASRTYTLGIAQVFGGNLSLIAPSSGSNTLTMAVSSNLAVDGGSQFSVNAGNDTSCGNLFVGTGVANGTVVVDGSGSTLAVSGTTTLGAQGITGALTFQNNAAGTFAGSLIVSADPDFGPGSSTGTVTVQSNADVTTAGDVTIGTGGITGHSGNITVAGAGSTFAQSGATPLTIGAASGSEGTLTVASGGSFTTGSGSTTVNDTGSISISGGIFTANGSITLNGGSINFSGGSFTANGSIAVNGGSINFSGGTFIANGSFVVGGAGPLGNNPTLSVGKSLAVSATTTIDAFSTLTLSGGSLSTASLVNNGTFNFTGGTLTITGTNGLIIGSGGPLGDTVHLTAGQTLTVTSQSFATQVGSTGTLVVDDGRLNAGGVVNNGEIRLAGAASRITGGGFINNKLLRGDGRIDNNITNASTGEIRAENGKTLLLTGANGANSGEINLQGGTIEFAQALTNGATGFIAGRGALYTGGLTNQGQMAFSGGNADIHGDVTLAAGSRVVTSGGGATTTFFDDVTHNGTEIFTGAGASSVFFGALSGAGPFTGTGTVYSIGDLRPGSSPATVSFGGDLVLGSSTTLTMELGGIMPGSGHDQLVVAGDLALDGTLAVSVLPGLTPAAGQSFKILDWGGLTGTFSTMNLPTLAGLAWDTSQLYTTGVLSLASAGLLGDYNQDGTVNAADYTVWRNNLGSATALPNDDTAGVGPDDFDRWKDHFGEGSAGSGAGSGASANTPVPEPATCSLVVLIAIGLIFSSRRLLSLR